MIRKMIKGDVREVAQLVSKTFKKFNCGELTKKELDFFLSHHSENKSDADLWKSYGSKISLVALDKKSIVGMIRGSEEYIRNLFVLGNYHGRGIGRKLVDKFEKQVKKRDGKKIKIRASIYAIPFYSACGYKKSTGIRTIHGIKVQPMVKELK